jgi:protein SCO1/2
MDTSKTRFLLLGLLVVGLGIVLGTALWLKLAPRPQFGIERTDSMDGIKQYGSVPDFLLTERNGSSVSLADLRGNIWVADFIYTTCRDTCPLQTAMMAKLQEEYAGKPEVRLVSFTVDPERDTPQVLKIYADKYRADADRWFFLTGPRNRILRLIQEGFHLSVATLPSDTDANGMIPHSPRFVLVDKQARIRGYYDSREQEALARLKNDIDALVKGLRDG